MYVNFLGGAGEVGRSAFLLKGTCNMMFDYGVKVEFAESSSGYPARTSEPVDALVLSHAHLDHVGASPMLYKNTPIPAFGTAPTIELSKLLINDSIKISKRNHAKQMFSGRNLKSFERSYNAINYGTEIDFNKYVLSLHDAGHICGSAITLLRNSNNDRRIAYTGDFKLSPQLLHSGAEVVKSDVLIIESTYATREHPDREEMTKKFVNDIREVIDGGGTALVPVFAVGRSQEIISMLYKNGLIEYVYIDGMAQEASEIVLRYPDLMHNSGLLADALKNTKWIGSERSRDSALSEPSIIVTTSGMLSGGPVLHYITRLNAKSKVFLTGYQVEGTNGSKILGGKPISVENKKFVLNVPVTQYDFSAHAGQQDLYAYIKKSGPEKIICVHGDHDNTKAFAENLKLEGYDAYAPDVGASIKIDF